jgi:hypothetical protein
LKLHFVMFYSRLDVCWNGIEGGSELNRHTAVLVKSIFSAKTVSLLHEAVLEALQHALQ